MRIIAGKYAKRNLFTLKSNDTRPTGDKVKESIFNSLGQFFDGGVVLDLYAGSGALGIEAISRGYTNAYLVDRAQPAVEIIKKNVELTKEPERFLVFKQPDFVALNNFNKNGLKFDLVFLDPPYKKQQIVKVMTKLDRDDLLNPDAVVVAETDSETTLGEVENFTIIKNQKYGNTNVIFYQYEKWEKMKKAIFPGSFDPFTNGHLQTVIKAAQIFDQIDIVVLTNTNKHNLFTAEERTKMIHVATQDLSNVQVLNEPAGLTVDVAQKLGANFIVRGLRSVDDFNYEKAIAQLNHRLNPQIETILLISDADHEAISSSMIKEIAKFGGDVRQFVPANVADALERKNHA